MAGTGSGHREHVPSKRAGGEWEPGERAYGGLNPAEGGGGKLVSIEREEHERG